MRAGRQLDAETLRQRCGRQGSFHQRKRLTDTQTWSAAKGKIGKAREALCQTVWTRFRSERVWRREPARIARHDPRRHEHVGMRRQAKATDVHGLHRFAAELIAGGRHLASALLDDLVHNAIETLHRLPELETPRHGHARRHQQRRTIDLVVELGHGCIDNTQGSRPRIIRGFEVRAAAEIRVLDAGVRRQRGRGPCNTMRPVSSTYASSATASAPRAFCSTKRTVTPSSRTPRIHSNTRCTIRGASPMLGSSSSSMRGPSEQSARERQLLLFATG